MNNALKLLAQKAKDRLRNASTNESTKEHGKVTTSYLSAVTRYAVIKSEKEITKDPLYNKVKKILTDTHSIIINPLGKLIDHAVFDFLTETAKQKYIIKLSERYRSLKTMIETEMLESI
ncbi:MAG: hypothetical protein RR334_01260 [Clostridia bacterium]